MHMVTRYRTDWRNVGLFGGGFHCGVKTPWGNLIAKRWENRLFSDRYGKRPTLKVFGWCVSWARLRHWPTIEDTPS